MKKKYFIMSPFEYEGYPRSQEISGKGLNQSIEALARITEKAQPFVVEKSMIIKIHHASDPVAQLSAEQLCGDLINAGYKNAISSELTANEKLTDDFITDKIDEAELIDGSHKIPVLCGFISDGLMEVIRFEEVKV